MQVTTVQHLMDATRLCRCIGGILRRGDVALNDGTMLATEEDPCLLPLARLGLIGSGINLLLEATKPARVVSHAGRPRLGMLKR